MDLWGIKHPIIEVIKYSDFKEWQPTAKKTLLAFLKREILRGIVAIKPKIHRLKISGDYELQDIINYLQVTEEIEVHKQPFWMLKSRMPGYQKFHTIEFKNRSLDIFTKPYNPHKPKSFIELSYPTPSILAEIGTYMPNLKISSAEYAVDFGFTNAKAAENFLFLLMHYLYIPSVGPTLKSPTGHVRYMRVNHYPENGIEYVWGKKDEHTKLYLRGPDTIRKKDWEQDDRIWVRFERTYKGKKIRDQIRAYYIEELLSREPEIQLLGEYLDGIREADNMKATLDEFIKNCFFTDLMGQALKLRIFNENVNFLPKEYERYFSVKDYPIRGSFQSMVFKIRNAKKTKKKFVPSRHIVKPEGFDLLLEQIERQSARFDEKWMKNELSDEDLYSVYSEQLFDMAIPMA